MSNSLPPTNIPEDGISTKDTIPTTNSLIAYSSIPVVRCDFNRGMFDRTDPLDFAGESMNGFNLSLSYPVDRQQHKKVINELYARVANRIQIGAIPEATVKLIDFNDIRTGTKEIPQRYLIVERETKRQTKMSTYVTFMEYGDYIFASVDSFMLGSHLTQYKYTHRTLVRRVLRLWGSLKFVERVERAP